MNYIQKILKWLVSLVLILLIGLFLITIYSAYYSFGTMIFGVHTESAIKDFWNTEILLSIFYIAVVLIIATVTAVRRLRKGKSN